FSFHRWWQKSNIMKKVPYVRDRSVECFIWSLALSYKPEDSNARLFGRKLISVTGLLDDTYDNYGTVQELEIFTKALERWDISLLEPLPQCMKVVFDTVVELCDEMELLTAQSGKSRFVVPHFKQAICNITKAYMVETKWCHEGHVPTYDEYKVNGVLTSCGTLFYISFIGLGEFATKDVFDWISSVPNIIKATSLIARLIDDMASHKFEQQRVHVASSVECCMKQYNISEVEAYNFIRKDIEDYWKLINEAYLNSNDIPKHVLDSIINYAHPM
ncbi:alpha-copaene synthase, partial [Cajanus cajan]|uniref:alpha-copaene synthase n=1 Tax=Cajanus cajan TaxID=3821 RepID=UPI0010FB118A